MRIARLYPFEFRHSLEHLWVLMSDTSRWTEAPGMQRYRWREDADPDHPARAAVGDG